MRLPRHLLVARHWRSRMGRRLHRQLDRQADAAIDRDCDPGHLPAAGEVSVMTNTRVLLTTLSVRTSAKGRQYLSGFLGKASVVAFEGQPDKFGNPTWDLFLSEPEPRDGRRLAARQQKRTPAPTGAAAGSSPAERRGGYRREGARARQERVSAEIARRHGVHSDADLNDEIGF